METAVYLYEGTTGFGDSVRAAFVERAAELGIEILDEIGYDPFGVTDLTTEMTRINALAPDVLVVTGYYNDGLLAARNAEEVALDVDLVFGVAQGTYDLPQFVTDAGDLAECFYDSNYHWDASDAAAARRTRELPGRIRRRNAHGGRPCLSGDVPHCRRRRTRRLRPIRRPSATRWPKRTTPTTFCPTSAPFSLTRRAKTSMPRPVVMQVQDGAIYQVWPPDVAERTPLLPCVSWNAG